MSSIDDFYPVSCPFCKISETYPFDPNSPVPADPDPEQVQPQCHLILSTPHVLAFLDIMPMAPGHILLTTRTHYEKLTNMYTTPDSKNTTWLTARAAQTARDSARAIGEWMPVVSAALCKVTGIEDWNLVQNNGARAAQVVPHVHFHFLPRYQEGRGRVGGKGHVDLQQARSWKMFGRGTREDLDDDEGREMAGRLREALREVLGEEEGKDGRTGKDKAKL